MNDFEVDDNIEKNKWLLDKQLTWISNGDIKIGAIVTLNLALLAGLGSYFPKNGQSILLDGLYVITTIITLTSIYFCKRGFKPKFSPPNHSNIYFGTIVKNDLSSFVSDINKVTKEDFADDLANQVHRNAQIAVDKYTCLSTATNFFLIAGAFGVLSISLTLFTSKFEIIHKVPEQTSVTNKTMR